jgi:hypothetical protein
MSGSRPRSFPLTVSRLESLYFKPINDQETGRVAAVFRVLLFLRPTGGEAADNKFLANEEHDGDRHAAQDGQC